MRLAFAAVVFAVLTTPLQAQTTKEKCAAVAGPMLEASDGISGLMRAMLLVDYTDAARGFGPKEAAHLARLSDSQAALLPHMELFLAELEATALAMRSCAR